MNQVLNLTKGCCTQGLAMSGMISPFRRAVALEADNGPIAGVAQCGRCGRSWQFLHLDTRQDTRVFLLTHLQGSALEDLLTGYSKVGKPFWPIWVPPPLSGLKADLGDSLRGLEERVFARVHGQPVLIVTKHLINGRILATAPPDPAERDWFARTGV